jgi:hypothetical protein
MEETDVVASLLGKEIVFPNALHFQVMDQYIKYDIATSNADYKIITYVDTTECISCRLHPWNMLINEFKSFVGVNIDFAMIVHSTDNVKKIVDSTKEYNFLNPICIDYDDTFNTLNQIPSKTKYHTVLLDSSNKIVAIGNPTTSPKVKAIYKQIVTNDIDDTDILNNRFCINAVRNIGVIHHSDTICARYELQNTSKRPLSIQEIIPSCDCMTLQTTQDTIPVGQRILITVTVKPNQDLGELYRYFDIFFNEKISPERCILYGFIK